jgi:hypothetical protein
LKPKSIFTIAQSHKKCITLPARNFFVAWKKKFQLK